MKIQIADNAGRYAVHFLPEHKWEGEPKTILTTPTNLLKIISAGVKEVFPEAFTVPFVTAEGKAISTGPLIPDSQAGHVFLDATVFPSTEPSIVSIVTDDKFHGAHDYEIKPMLRYDNGTVYGLEGMPITFVKRLPDGTFRPGIQTEQLLLVIEDRHPKLNAEFPAEEHEEFMGHIRAARECLERRFRKRLDRGVAGEHKA